MKNIERRLDKSPLKRFYKYVKDPNSIEDMKTKLDNALSLFQVRQMPPEFRVN